MAKSVKLHISKTLSSAKKYVIKQKEVLETISEEEDEAEESAVVNEAKDNQSEKDHTIIDEGDEEEKQLSQLPS